MRRITSSVIVLVWLSSLNAQTDEVAASHRAFAELGADKDHDVNTTQQLALLYAEGRLIPADLVVACGLFRFALGYAGGPDPAVAIQAERLANEQCARLSDTDFQEALSWMECPQFGVQPEFITLEPGYWIELVRRRVRIQSPRGTFDHERIIAAGCLSNLALTRHTKVEPPSGAKVLPRHLIESVTWLSQLNDGQPLRRLQWLVEEVNGDTFKHVVFEDLVTEPGSAWPAPELPQELLDGVMFRMNRTGEIDYLIGGKFQRRGIIE